MNIPNLLTLSRIILVPIIIISLLNGAFTKAIVFFIIACVTDGLDGFLARILNQRTILGSYLDPLADKALIAASFIALSILGVIPGWLTVIVVSRDFIILLGVSVLFLMSISLEIKPAFVSKVTTVFQFLTVFFALISQVFPEYRNPGAIRAIYWATALFTIASGFNYIFRGIKLINSDKQ